MGALETAVEITTRDDSLDIWVDANNNGIKDDDDVNIYVTAGGGFYTTSPTFNHPLDSEIQSRIKELAVDMLANGNSDQSAITTLRELSLELVIRATMPAVKTAIPSDETLNTAVVITRGRDNLDIWVDANNNGVQDDDDVNIYVTVSGGFYTTSPTFKYPLDSEIQDRIKHIAIELLTHNKIDLAAERTLRELAFELVAKATGLNDY